MMKTFWGFLTLFWGLLPANAQLWEYTLVDLGLPSGTLWADRNLGAPTPYEPGDFYAWGETEIKQEYNADNYTLSTKDCFEYLSADHDAAWVKTDGNCKIPNQKECIELCRECTWEWVENRYYRGMKVTGPNGNSIFLLAAGLMQGASNTWRDSGNYLTENDVAYSNADYVGCRFLDFQDSGFCLQVGEEGTWYYRRGIKKLRTEAEYMLNSDVKYWGRLIRPVGTEKTADNRNTAETQPKGDSKKPQPSNAKSAKKAKLETTTKKTGNSNAAQKKGTNQNASAPKLPPLKR